MQKIIYSLGSTCLNIALRAWTKNEKTYIVNSIFDIKKLADELGCSFVSNKCLEQNIQEFLISFTERLEDSHLMDGISDDRKKIILIQLSADISDSIKIDKDTISLILGDKDLKSIVEKKSFSERKTWDIREQGVYSNCLRFAVDAIVKFIQLLPEYSPEVSKILYQRNCEAFTQIGEQLDTIIKMLNSQRGTIDEYREFEIDYLRKTENKYKKIVMFGSGLSRRKAFRYNINTSYIELTCAEEEESYSENTIALSNIFEKHNLVWVSGEAGGGKTTFIQWLAVNSAIGSLDKFAGLIPVVIQLRTLTSFPINIGKEIEHALDVQCPKDWINYLVKYDKLLLMFDGVDELSVYNRNEFYSFVEDMMDEFKERKCKKSKIVITSRPYVEDELDIIHSHYRILRMSSKNIEKFIKYWHRTILVDEENSNAIEEISNRLVEVINKNYSIKSIASTPLLCAMICALNYINNESIPANRNELYEKCCHMLIEDRDRERHIIVTENNDLNNLDYTRKSILLEKVAYFMMTKESVEIEKKTIEELIKNILHESTIIDSFALKENPVILIDYLVQRTGLLREPSNGKIDFVHKTFLEYLGAKALCKSSNNDIFIEKAIEPFWKEAIIMCFNQMDQERTSTILDQLLDLYYDTSDYEYLFMASLCVQNASITKKKIEESIQDEIKKLIPPKAEHIRRLEDTGDYILPFLCDRSEYNNRERKNCLVLLEHILYREKFIGGLQVLMTYMYGKGDFACKSIASNIITEYEENAIQENRVREDVVNAVNQTMIHNGKCVLSVEMLYLMKYSYILKHEYHPIKNP